MDKATAEHSTHEVPEPLGMYFSNGTIKLDILQGYVIWLALVL